ncbi:Wzz/FepE/Etk N-terminal domain-containing protein [Alkalihalophilus lindianensis]|uniref:Wzz/FepE/Etk N-terminal domain-containing protein n=1 Tax=Alkalihalophilus lindianensis TaxID=1630542 RepID=A0ABU3X9D8_9BACI|nr:Wzz/FepE/Etk N-terminal domain-containing protein [Alkalihalophilus lindianensis]MDV2684418.1 Wzz/FepE/Etk N-terminal domain-containing protein [Alkalihalophilus lindianensis]
MEETISLKDIYNTLRRRLMLLILVPIIAVVLAGLVSYLVLTPIYQSSTQILVNQTQQDQSFSQNDIRTNVELINTYTVIIKSPTILDKVIAEANLTESFNDLNNKISVSSENNSQVMNIRVEHERPEVAAQIANTIATVFQREIVEIMSVDNVSILSSAQVSDSPSPIKPNPTLNMAIAFVVGLMTAVGIAFLLEFLDTTIKSEEDIESLLELPILGAIPDMNKEIKRDLKKSS